MKSFYEFWKMMDKKRRLMEFQATGGAVTQGTDQGGGMGAAGNKPDQPAKNPNMGMVKQSDPGVGPSIGADPLEPIAKAKEDLEDAVSKARQYMKATQGNEPPQFVQMTQTIDQLDQLMKQMGHDKDANDQKQSQKDKEKQDDQNRSQQNMTANGPPQVKPAAPGGGLGTQGAPSPGTQGTP